VTFAAIPEFVVAATGIDPLRYFTADEIREWRAFREPHYVAGHAMFAVDVALYVWLVFFHGSRRIKGACDRLAERWLPANRHGVLLRVMDRVWRDRTWVGALLFVLAFTTLFALTSLPKQAYFLLVYDKRYGLSTYTVPRFIRDFSVGTLQGIVLLSVLMFSLYALMRRVDRWWIPLGIVAAAFSVFSGVIDPYREVLQFEDKPLADGPARTAVSSVLSRAHVENAGIYVRNASRVTKAGDALFVGQGPSRRIIIYDNLLAALTPRELAVVIGHEAGHVGESRLWPSIATAAVMFALIFALDRILRAMARRPRFGLSGHADPAGLPVAFLLVTVFIEVAEPFSSAYTRSLERAADAFGIEITADPDAFVSMLVKVARLDKVDVDPPAWIRWEFTHPTVLDRIAFGESKKKEAGDPINRPPPGTSLPSPTAIDGGRAP
jgi:STE24 endopeptidase